MISRRDFMKLAAAGGGAVFISGLPSPGRAAAEKGSTTAYADEFYFVQLSDAHWGYRGPDNPEAANTLRKRRNTTR